MHEDKIRNQEKDKLYEAILSLESAEDCRRFFEDLCTINEINAMAQRLEVAVLLNQGETFNQIVDKTGASTATISRVNRCLKYGAGGYRSILSK
ncbi:MAG: YerC/YecD family TrpR-related protein [Clostridia bacterium]